MLSESEVGLLARLRAALAGRYDVDRELGHGGMATVFLAQDLRLHRRVAIKVLTPEFALTVGIERFVREIRIAAQLQHPNIVPLYESGEAGGLLYYVMAYVEGEPLRARLERDRQLPLDEVLGIARGVANALSYAHSHDVVHRDIKPDNVLLSGAEALVVDFGIARVATALGADRVTATGMTVGTPGYMSPEQAGGGVQIDARSDVYSLACVVYEMLVGHPPFLGATPQELVARHAVDPVPSLRTARPTVSPALEGVVLRALEKSPADRYPTAAAFLAAMEAAERTKPDVRERPRVRPGVLALVVVILVVSVAAVLVGRRLGVGRGPPPDPRRVVVFPASVGTGSRSNPLLGEDVAMAMLAALNSTRFVRAVDGWRLLVEAERVSPQGVSARAAASMARSQRAAFFVVGRIVVGDSLHLVAEVVDVRADSVVQRTVSLPRAADGWTIGVAGARAILPSIVGSDQPMDLAALGSSTPAGATAFLLGQREYRRGRFEEAYLHFRAAVGEDSSFALAAIMGAQTADWVRLRVEGNELARVALRRASALPPRYMAFVRGLSAWWQGQPDTAVAYLEAALTDDPAWPEAWAELGEVYAHSLPRRVPADSLLDAAFATAYRLDTSFIPPLYHLIEVAARKRDVARGERLLRAYRASEPDTTELAGLALALRCVATSPGEIDWREEARHQPQQLDDIAGALAAGTLPQAPCARAAWSAVLEYDTATDAGALKRREHALLGLQHTLLAARRYDEARALLRREARVGRQQCWQLVVVSGLAGAPFEQEVTAAAESLRAVARAGGPDALGAWWYVGVWAARRGDAVTLTAALKAVRHSRATTRRDSLVGRTLTAWASLANGDTVAALRAFHNLGAGARDRSPWESQGAERLQEAELLAARGRNADAIRVATEIDAPGSLRNVVYLPASLAVRVRAARALGDQQAATRFAQRLAALTGETTARAP